MAGSRFGISHLGFGLVFPTLILLLGIKILAAEDGSSVSNAETLARCNLDLSSFIPLPYSDTSNMICKPLWNSYVLHYSQSKDHVVTIILSALYTSGWVGIAFSKNGMMLNSSAVVGWINNEVKQYYLKGFEQADVVPDKGNLPLTNVPAFVALRGANIYIAFQLKYLARLGQQPVLLAFSSRYPTKHHHLYAHDDKTTVLFDFSAGTSSGPVADSASGISSNSASVSAGPNDIVQLKKNHGLCGLMGWGLFLPYGAIAARYFKHHDPLWYYLHAGIQFVGFMLGLAGVLLGVSLYKRIDAHFPTHRGIGVFVLVLSILQILAFFARPGKDSKMRKYWNWYHHWVGRIALFLGNLNIVLGIQIGGAGSGWKGGYGFLLASVLIATVVLEVLLRIRRSKANAPPAFQLNSLQ